MMKEMSYSDTTSIHDELIQINLKTSNELKKQENIIKNLNRPNPIKNILLISVPRLTVKQLTDEFKSLKMKTLTRL